MCFANESLPMGFQIALTVKLYLIIDKSINSIFFFVFLDIDISFKEKSFDFNYFLKF